MSVWGYIIGSFILLLALIIIGVVLLQEGRRAGISGAISGAADSFLSKNKARSVDAKLARWTKYIVIAFFVLILAANIIAIALA
ncbi:MAG: preprotein translocase subunit SecG [Firmicutes bacterium]|nr:preprotein translocase subunit SecG [Bacillota bacterium]